MPTNALEKVPVRRGFRVIPLLGGALFLLCLWAFLEIAEDYPEGQYRAFDELILKSLRTPADLGVPRGPLWLKGTMNDLSALGGAAVLTVVVAGVTGYLILLRRWSSALSVVFASLGGLALNTGLKALTARPRPDIVPHLAESTSSSFPSGHSMLSAIVYLSMGVVLAQHSPSKRTALYALFFAGLLTFIVGCTRVYLGVHYPSDVLAGWAAGTAWALLCAATQMAFEKRTARLI